MRIDMKDQNTSSLIFLSIIFTIIFIILILIKPKWIQDKDKTGEISLSFRLLVGYSIMFSIVTVCVLIIMYSKSTPNKTFSPLQQSNGYTFIGK
jgi:hypothetical protein